MVPRVKPFILHDATTTHPIRRLIAISILTLFVLFVNGIASLYYMGYENGIHIAVDDYAADSVWYTKTPIAGFFTSISFLPPVSNLLRNCSYAASIMTFGGLWTAGIFMLLAAINSRVKPTLWVSLPLWISSLLSIRVYSFILNDIGFLARGRWEADLTRIRGGNVESYWDSATPISYILFPFTEEKMIHGTAHGATIASASVGLTLLCFYFTCLIATRLCLSFPWRWKRVEHLSS
jgi:hypothetical protein